MNADMTEARLAWMLENRAMADELDTQAAMSAAFAAGWQAREEASHERA